MPYGDPEPGDPQVLIGVSLEGTEETTRAMAEAFADEFAQLGHSREKILTLFGAPFYAGAHAAYLSLGEPEIRRIVDESVRVWGRLGRGVQDAGAGSADKPRHSGINAVLAEPRRKPVR